MTIAAQGIADWHAYMKHGHDPERLAAMLDDDCVFHSPVVHTPQEGKAKVLSYLNAAGSVFDDTGFRYVREIIDANDAVLEFTSTIDGIVINGIDMISFNSEGKIREFKVMVRPLKAINLIWNKMAAQLEAAKTAA